VDEKRTKSRNNILDGKTKFTHTFGQNLNQYETFEGHFGRNRMTIWGVANDILDKIFDLGTQNN